MLLGGVSEQSPPLLGDGLLLLGDVETVADRLSPLAVLVLPPPLAEAVICSQHMSSDLCSPPPPQMSLIMEAMPAPLSTLRPRQFVYPRCKPHEVKLLQTEACTISTGAESAGARGPREAGEALCGRSPPDRLGQRS